MPKRAIQMLAAITDNTGTPGGRLKAVGPHLQYLRGPEDRPPARRLGISDGFPGRVAMVNHHVSNRAFERIRDGSAGRPEACTWQKNISRSNATATARPTRKRSRTKASGPSRSRCHPSTTNFVAG